MYRNCKPIYCCNCGKQGHIYKKCKEPITSFGVIAFKLDDGMETVLNKLWNTNKNDHNVNSILSKAIKENVKLLLIRRKDTLGYVEFVRGKYNFGKLNMLRRTFNIMTTHELHKIKTLTFDEIWADLWLTNCHNSKKYTKEYESSKHKYNQLRNGLLNGENNRFSLDTLIRNCKNKYTEQEWGLPKGRKNIKETFVECAEREFQEETGVKKGCYKIIKDLKPLEEIFMGTNNLRYKHVYYIANCNKTCQVSFNKNNKTQVVEISAVQWFTCNDAVKILRPYNIAKKNIIKSSIKIITAYLLNKIKNKI